MRKQDIKDRARKWLELSLDADRQVCPERVRAVLDTVKQGPARKLKPQLKEYLNQVRREQRKGQAVVEHSGELSEQSLKDIAAHFTQLYGRPITVVTRRNPTLIAGMRVRVGDDVYEDSVSSRLNNLSHAVLA